ncbi:hypothetical protein [Gloeobacter violaceus]|uniref:hypothetical protein n=1 Tax=Gloeobacter violaceus TaxID=33072 RepID=UPI0013E8B7BF|nr:hypothetical protein [Gloeobacter violaceus]
MANVSTTTPVCHPPAAHSRKPAAATIFPELLTKTINKLSLTIKAAFAAAFRAGKAAVASLSIGLVVAGAIALGFPMPVGLVSSSVSEVSQ